LALLKKINIISTLVIGVSVKISENRCLET
jgi:hypothetical protein